MWLCIINIDYPLTWRLKRSGKHLRGSLFHSFSETLCVCNLLFSSGVWRKWQKSIRLTQTAIGLNGPLQEIISVEMYTLPICSIRADCWKYFTWSSIVSTRAFKKDSQYSHGDVHSGIVTSSITSRNNSHEYDATSESSRWSNCALWCAKNGIESVLRICNTDFIAKRWSLTRIKGRNANKSRRLIVFVICWRNVEQQHAYLKY